MAISRQLTGDYLDAWRDVMREDIWRYNQVLGAGIIDIAEGVYIQPDRDYIANALNIAKRRIVSYLGYPLRPEWVTNELVPLPARGYTTRGWLLSTAYKNVQAIGKRATTLIAADATVTYSETGGTGIDDTATVTVTSSVATDEIAAFFRVADGANAEASERYQILPLDVTSDGTTVTITGHRALFVKPNEFWDRPYQNSRNLERRHADTQTAGDFVTGVDVYRVYPETSEAVALYYNDDCDTPTIKYADVTLIDDRLGLYRISSKIYGVPDRMYINYQAGAPLDNGRMQPDLANALTRFANVEMPYRPLNLFAEGGAWQRDNEIESIASERQNNPFGVYKGHYAAWQITQARMIYA